MASNPLSVTFREFRFEDDYEAARSLWASAGPGIHLSPSDEPDEILKKLERDPDLFLVAEENGRLIGTVIGGFDGRRGLIYHLAVSPELRNRGIGKALMAEVERRLLEKGCIRSYLLVVPGDEEIAQFYTNLGWEKMNIVTFGKYLGE